MEKKTKRSRKWIWQKEKKLNSLGTLLVADFWHCKEIESKSQLKEILIEAAKKSKNIPLGIKIYKFSPQGMTGVLLLAESHIALHSWPELNYLAIDIFSCGKKASPERALNFLKKKFKPKKVRIFKIKRGII